jgi:hypothetical protein
VYLTIYHDLSFKETGSREHSFLRQNIYSTGVFYNFLFIIVNFINLQKSRLVAVMENLRLAFAGKTIIARESSINPEDIQPKTLENG